MASFVENSLIDGEKIEARAEVTWASQICLLVLAVLTVATLILPVIFIIAAILNVKTTELAVTNKKVIGRTGWIARRSIDLPLQKVESFSVEEGIVGRLLGYGCVIISGTGGHNVKIPYIKDPMAFKRTVLTLIDKRGQADK